MIRADFSLFYDTKRENLMILPIFRICITAGDQFVSWRFGFGERQQANYIKIAEKFEDQNSNQLLFSNIVLLELSKAPSVKLAL